jgi:hypothetical protein
MGDKPETEVKEKPAKICPMMSFRYRTYEEVYCRRDGCQLWDASRLVCRLGQW